MKPIIAVTSALILAIPALANDLGNQAPPKLPSIAAPNVPDPSRQGGDTLEQAFPIPALPYFDTGTTTGFSDDYDEICPTGSLAPDVVYIYSSPVDQLVNVDLCGSGYDTKVYIINGDLGSVACSDDYYADDFCGIYRSRIAGAPFLAGGTYYIIVDGYGNEHGDYILAVTVHASCDLACPANGTPEGEPPLPGDYTDDWNGGCNTSESNPPLQPITGDGVGEAVLCGVSGWRGAYSGRDTDWFTTVMGHDGVINVTADAEVATHVFELLPPDCAAVAAAGHLAVECGPASLTLSGYDPGNAVWLWVAPASWARPSWAAAEYDYVLWFSGLEPTVATEATTWSRVKALYE